MDERTHALLDMADKEFKGKTPNGPSLMETLDSLDAERAAFAGTFEGYSAWGVALHCLYYKYLIAEGLGAGAELEPYPFEKADFAPAPPKADGAAWKAARDYLRLAHRVCMDVIRSSDSTKMDSLYSPWKMTYLDVVSWLCGHDAYHNAQIRSMGVPGLKTPKRS